MEIKTQTPGANKKARRKTKDFRLKTKETNKSL